VESQLQYRMANNFGNDTGVPTDLNFSDEIRSSQQIYFAQLQYDVGQWRFAAGLSLNALDYRVDRTFSAGGATGITESEVGGVASPRISALYDFGRYSLYATVSSGFSPPTLDEFRTNEGSLNTELRPERGVNYEVGGKGSLGPISYAASLFYLKLSEAISTFSDARGTTLFRNAGDTDQYGLELALEYRPARWLEVYGSYTYHRFTYGNYEHRGEVYSGNRLSGTAPHVVNLEATARFGGGFYATLSENYTDAIPLNDANDVYGEAYHLVRGRVGYRRGRWDFFAGGSNLLDQRMSLGNDLNPQFGGRYFQPAAGRTFFVGVGY
jgi:iron complex outermembrane receptor protein